ncbi:MAG: DUF3575 domain-containing protein [Ferruginibacter sp.]
MKLYRLSLLGICICLMQINVWAQDEPKTQEKATVASGKMNMVKLNVSALIFKNISVQYERKLSKRFSFAGNVHFIPFGRLPFSGLVKRAINDASVPVDKFKLGSFGFTPEVRWYVGKRGVFNGFYLGLFGAYNNYKADLPINYSNDTKTGIFTGELKTTTGGLQIGAQWKLSDKVYLDWWIIGGNFGQGKGNLKFTGALLPSEQTDIIDQIEKLKDDLPFNVIESYTVNGQGATIFAKGPWAGLRGMGFNIGIRF